MDCKAGALGKGFPHLDRRVRPKGACVNVHESAHWLSRMPGVVYSGTCSKDADPRHPHLKEAKADYAKLQ